MTVRESEEMFGHYDLGLTPSEEARAGRLHTETIVIDMFSMGPCGYRTYTDDMNRQITKNWETFSDLWRTWRFAQHLPERMAVEGTSPVFQTSWEASGVKAANRQALWNSLEEAVEYMGLIQAEFDRLPWLDKALTASDIRKASSEGRKAGFINTEDVTALTKDLNLLDHMHDLGVRMVAPTYNSQNAFGAGCTERTNAGLSQLGIEFVARMNELGLIVDTAHCGQQTTLDICSHSQHPVVASHTSAAAVHSHDRAKGDEELLAIAETGGVVGIYAIPAYLTGAEAPTIDAMLDHIDYVAKLIGWQHVGIGTDSPVQAPQWVATEIWGRIANMVGFRPEHMIDLSANLVGFDDYRDFPNITRGLVRRGYADDRIAGILGLNFLRVFETVCG